MMELTYGILYDLLKKEFTVSSLRDGQSEKVIHSVQLWNGENVSDEILYLTAKPVLPQADNILLFADASCSKETSHWRLILPSGDVFAAINRVLEIYQKFIHWTGECIRLANVAHDLQKLLDISTAFLNIHLFINDKDYKMSYMSFSESYYFEGQETYMSDSGTETIEELYQADSGFDNTYMQKGLQYYRNAFEPDGKLYYYNLFYGKLYLARVLILISEKLDGAGIRRILEFLCLLIETCYLNRFLNKNNRAFGGRLEEIWENILSRRPIDMDRAIFLLKQHTWEPAHCYEVIRMMPCGYFHSVQTLRHYSMLMESLFPACIVIPDENMLCCLHNLSMDTDNNFRERLADFLKENLFLAGISNRFQDIFDGYRYFLQAESALELGQKHDPSLWRYHFSDYAGKYMLKKCLSQYSARDLCPENLRKLLEYDETHPDNPLTETLYQYYACQFNAQKAAEKLFIHRTTFFYRLNKIRKIAPFHPEDIRETTYILAAFALLAHEKLFTVKG